MSESQQRRANMSGIMVTIAAITLATFALLAMFMLMLQPSHAITVTTPDAGRGPHANYLQPTVWCARCHQVHSGVTQRFLRGYWNQDKAATEEGTCYTCHDGTGAGATLSVYNLKAQFDKTYSMPIGDSVNVHIGREPSGTNDQGVTQDPVGPNSRHVECLDCHNPHVDRGPNHMTTAPTNAASKKLAGVWGVTVDYDGLDWDSWTTEFDTGDVYSTVTPDIIQEWQLCFKCHSAFAYAFDPPVSPTFTSGVHDTPGITYTSNAETDQSKEFNPANASYHPVMAPGKNDFTSDAQGASDWSDRLKDMTSDANGQLTPTSTIHCSDCHRAEASETSGGPGINGPHGSDNPFILMGIWDFSIDDNGMGANNDYGDSPVLCFNCHDQASFTTDSTKNTGFYGGRDANDDDINLHGWHLMTKNEDDVDGRAPITCMNCHTGVPHGSKWPHLLVTDDDDVAPYKTSKSRLKSTDNWMNKDSQNYQKSDCSGAMAACEP